MHDDPLAYEIETWTAIVEEMIDKRAIPFRVFPFSYQVLLQFFRDLVKFMKDHLSTIPVSLDGGKKRIKRIGTLKLIYSSN